MQRSSSSPRRRVGVALLAGALASLGVVGCSKGPTRDPQAFCDRLAVVQPALTDPSDPVALVALYEDLADEVPLQIQDDWRATTLLLADVISFDPSDPAELQAVQTAVLRSQAAVTSIAQYVQTTCGIELGPIPTTVPIGGTGDQLLSDVSTDAVTDGSIANDTAADTDSGGVDDTSG